ncbi:MAG: rod-binding protein [Pseudobdellovibrionaceae bacterium]|nr:rod-binding protein [Bdellovibrionales bacterium]USN46483.1 MAG: rod-binding protein [Pseudobdellovibrionaceae bacterium]
MRQASQMYEQHFLREMVKAMRSTVQNGGLMEPTMAEKIYREKIDDSYVESWANKGGIGLGDMIYNQLRERLQAQNAKGFHEQKGALPIANEKYLAIKNKKPVGKLD